MDASPKLKALGHPVRHGIALRLAAEGGTCACDFAEIFGISQPAVSQHLKVLREAGLVHDVGHVLGDFHAGGNPLFIIEITGMGRDGTQIYYSLDPGGVAELQSTVVQLAA